MVWLYLFTTHRASNRVISSSFPRFDLKTHFALRVLTVAGCRINCHVLFSSRDFISILIASIHLAQSGLLKLTASW